MHSAHELLTRWPAFDVAAKRPHLQNSLHLSPGPLAGAWQEALDAADHAAAGLWRRDPSGWSSEPSVQKEIADRFGWLSSAALMADSLDRLTRRAVRDRSRTATMFGYGTAVSALDRPTGEPFSLRDARARAGRRRLRVAGCGGASRAARASALIGRRAFAAAYGGTTQS